MAEEWKPLYNSNDHEVSTLGRLRKLVNLRGLQKTNGGLLRPTIDSDGYSKVNINGKSWQVHKLVLLTFRGPDSDPNRTWIDHVDHDRTNNRIDNLRWVTKTENAHNRKRSSNNSSGIPNISQTLHGSWTVNARYDGRTLEKTCKTKELAIAMYDTLMNDLRNGHPGRTRKYKPPSGRDGRPQDEVWKNAERLGFPGYDVSFRGLVWSRLSGKLMTPIRRRQGYTLCLTNSEGNQPGTQLVHQLVAKLFIPNPENHMIVDHINRDPYDNVASNLRWCSHLQNMQNKSIDKRNKSGESGVSKNGRWWKAVFNHNRRRIVVGLRFETREAAVDAIRAARLGVSKEFAPSR